MKKQSLIVVFLLMVLAVFINSCDDDTDPVGPTIAFFGGGGEFIDEDVTVEPGAELAFSFLATKGDAKLASLDVQIDGLHPSGYPLTDIPNDNYQDTIYMEADADDGVYEYLFIISDNDGLVDSASFTIEVLKTWDPIDTWANLQLFAPGAGGQTNTNCASVDGSVFTYNDGTADSELQDKADFVYYYVTNAVMAAPNVVPSTINDGYSAWTTLNPTKFYEVDVTASEFDAMEDDELIIEKVTGTSASTAEDLAVDDVVGFETNAGKLGMFKVTELQPGYNVGDYIKIDIKVQQTAK